MGARIQIPDIPEEARTPLVKGLVDVMEQLVQKVRPQEEKIAQLEDELAVLKGEKKRPRFKPSQLDKRAGREEGTLGEGKGPGSEKRSKTALLVIHEEEIIAPAEAVPEGLRFKGYREVGVQDLVNPGPQHALSSGAMGDAGGTHPDGGVTGISARWAFRGDVGQLQCVSTPSLPGHPTVSVRAIVRVGH